MATDSSKFKTSLRISQSDTQNLKNSSEAETHWFHLIELPYHLTFPNGKVGRGPRRELSSSVCVERQNGGHHLLVWAQQGWCSPGVNGSDGGFLSPDHTEAMSPETRTRYDSFSMLQLPGSK